MIKVEKNEKKFFQKLFQKIHFALILKMSVFWKIQKSFCEKKRFFGHNILWCLFNIYTLG